MQDNSLPTSDYDEFNDHENASKYLATKKMPIVIKYDGLAAGKGVDVCDSLTQADLSIKNLLKPGESIIIEDFLLKVSNYHQYIFAIQMHQKNL